jgi:hypothetical protein
MVGNSASEGIPLLTRVLLVRATARFDPSFPGDAHRASPAPYSSHPGRSPTTCVPPYAALGAVHVHPSLRIVAHYTRSTSRSDGGSAPLPSSPVSSLRRATNTPSDDADFFASHTSLHQLLLSLAASRLDEKVKLRQAQMDVARTAVKMARVSAESAAAAAAVTAASPDVESIVSGSFAAASISSSALMRGGGGGGGLHGATISADDETSQTATGTSNSNQQVQGMLAAVTATFAEDAAWRSLTTPYRSQLNPWSLTSVSDEGCYLTFPSPAFVHWSEIQAGRCCTAAELGVGTMEPDTQNGPMRYNDVVHFASVVGGVTRGDGSSSGEGNGYLHGYAFLLDGVIFAGSREHKANTSSTVDAPFSDDDGEVSVLLWCVLSDAPVFNFMRSLTLEVVAAMSYVAKRTYHAAADAVVSRGGRGVGRTDAYTATLDSALDAEVVRPLAAELVVHGTVASRTLPGESFTITLPLTRDSQSSAPTRPQTSSMSGALTFRRPLDLLFPFADVPLSVLLLSFGEDALRVLQSLLLQEERVVIIGATPQHASACVISVLSLIAPFTWVSPLIPYLPPHTAAQSGVLCTLLSTPYEHQRQKQRQQQQNSLPVASRPAPYPSRGASLQSSQQMESEGFLLGSTAGIRPYLMFLSAFGVTEGGCGGTGARSGRAPHVWIADARTGAVGVCPTEPISPYLLVDAQTADSSSSNSKIRADRSCTAHGGASAWTLHAHLDIRAVAPQMYTSQCSGTARAGSPHNPYVLYNTVRHTLRTAVELHALDAVPLDVLPPFNDELCDALRRVAPAEKRRQFRQALEELTQHTHVRLENLSSLAARLARGLRQAIKAAAAAAAAATATTASPSNAMRLSSFSADSIDSGSGYVSGSDSDSASASDDDDDIENAFQMDENASFRAVTEAVAQSHTLAFHDPSSPSGLVKFPALTSHETLQVQSAFLGYVVDRLAGAYRRGITVVSGAPHRSGCRRRFMEASVFLAPGLDQHYTLAETIARTHLFRQFSCAMLAAEAVGLRRVLGGSELQVHSPNEAMAGGGSRSGEAHVMLKLVRPLAMFAILCDRARLQYPELYADVPALDAAGTVYAALVKRCFAHRPGPPATVLVPPVIRSLAGSSAPSDPHRAGAIPSSSSATYGSGGSGSGLRGFLTKVAKAMKRHGSNGDNGGGGGGGGGGRGLPVLYIPASVACMNSFAVAPFSAQHVAPESFNITTYDDVGPDGKPRRHHRHHHHQGGGNAKKGGRRSRKQYLADLYAIPVKPQRQQWARQQQHQQRTAIGMDFTLDDCTTAPRSHIVPGGAGELSTSSFATSATAVGMGGSGGGGGVAGVSNGSVYVSGVGLDAEVLTALARSGGARSGSSGNNDAAIRAMAEASLNICHELPLDIVHQFDAYEPLLGPLTVVSSSAATMIAHGKTAALADDVTSPAAFMGVGLMCPSCVNIWREGETRATRVLQERHHQTTPSPSSSPQRKQGASPPMHARSTSSLQLPPPAPPLPSQPLAEIVSGTEEGGAPATSWGTFTSGAPLGYPIDNTPRNLAGMQTAMSPPIHVRRTTPSPPASRGNSVPQPPRANTHPDAWDTWGVQGPVVVNTPNTATAVANNNNNSSGASSCATRGGETLAAPTALKMSTSSSNPRGGGDTGEGSHADVLPSTLTLSSVVLPVSAPAPGDVMDELFAGLSNYSNNCSSANSAAPPQPRRQTLDDFF